MRIHGSRLRPGVHVLRRDDRHVQIGLDPPHRVILPADPEVLDLLDQLRDGTAATVEGEASGVLRTLDAAGLLEPCSSQLIAERGAKPRVAIASAGLDLSALTPLLEAAGIGAAVPGRPADVHVVAASGPLSRERLDPLIQEGAPHLVVAGTGRPGSLRLGPFVLPGITACLRCVDAHESGSDPRRPLLVAQLSELRPAPVDPTVVGLACAWAACEIASYVAQRRPATWSGTVDLDLEVPVVQTWERHPWCGCAWDLAPY